MRLRLKLTFGFFIIAIMLFIAGAWSVIQVKSTQSFLKDLLENNLRKIVSTRTLYESVEKNQEGGMLFLLKKEREGAALLDASDSIFTSNLSELQKSETDKEGTKLLNKIGLSYTKLVAIKKSGKDKLFRAENSIYLNSLYQQIKIVEADVKALQKFYIDRMEKLNLKIQESESKSITPGLVAMTAAIIFALLFSFFVNHYIVTPIVNMKNKIDEQIERGVPYEYDLEADDEISELSESIRILSTRIIPKD
jgi:methyl-accepting chemotaxis protein